MSLPSQDVALRDYGQTTTVRYKLGEEPIIMQLASTRFTVGVFWKNGGSVYERIHLASFGNNEKVIAKRSSTAVTTRGVTNVELIRNDQLKTELLQYNPAIARMFALDVADGFAYFVMEKYHRSLVEYVGQSSVGKIFRVHNPIEIMRQLIDILQFLGSHDVFHRDLRLKNMFIHLKGGKSIDAYVDLLREIKNILF